MGSSISDLTSCFRVYLFFVAVFVFLCMYDSSQMFSHARKLQSHSVSLGISSLTRPQLRKQCMTALSGAANFEFVESRTSRDGKVSSRQHFRLLGKHDFPPGFVSCSMHVGGALPTEKQMTGKKPASLI